MRFLFSVATIVVVSAATLTAAAKGPLRVLRSNPRYFTDGSGRAIYLAGSHNWSNLVDNGHRKAVSGDPPPVFDYDSYLNFLVAHHDNFFRLWRWEVPKWTDVDPRGVVKYATPHPWLRTGPGVARDGKPRFDLKKFDNAYFDRLRRRVMQARDKNVYVSVMLFEGWAAQFTDAWLYHPFHGGNNVNGVDASLFEYYRIGFPFTDFVPESLRFASMPSMGRFVLSLQELYIRKVVDTLSDLDNVLFEVCNESGTFSTDWQYHIIDYVRKYQSTKSQQKPVGMTVQYRNGLNETVFKSQADWVSPNADGAAEDYRNDPLSIYRGKVVVNDTDHLWGHTGGDRIWVWKSFMRGLNVLLMEELPPSPTWQDSAREGMRQTRLWSERIDLGHMTPSQELAGTRYCLANRNNEYLVFRPNDDGAFQVDLRGAASSFRVEWFDINRNESRAAGVVGGGQWMTFNAPFKGPAALYLKVLQ